MKTFSLDDHKRHFETNEIIGGETLDRCLCMCVHGWDLTLTDEASEVAFEDSYSAYEDCSKCAGRGVLPIPLEELMK